MGDAETYEYAEVIAGYFHRSDGLPLGFMQVTDIKGREVRPDIEVGGLGALNMMGAQGWQYLYKFEPGKNEMMPIWTRLALHDDKVEHQDWHGEGFLMMRRVRE